MAGQTDENRLHVLRHAAFTARDVREMERPLLENGVPLMSCLLYTSDAADE